MKFVDLKKTTFPQILSIFACFIYICLWKNNKISMPLVHAVKIIRRTITTGGQKTKEIGTRTIKGVILQYLIWLYDRLLKQYIAFLLSYFFISKMLSVCHLLITTLILIEAKPKPKAKRSQNDVTKQVWIFCFFFFFLVEWISKVEGSSLFA